MSEVVKHLKGLVVQASPMVKTGTIVVSPDQGIDLVALNALLNPPPPHGHQHEQGEKH